jgi:hypothetical protein
MTVGGVIRALISDPRRTLIELWNWKSALFSSVIRAFLFLFANLTAGWKLATAAMLAEFLYRAATAGFYGAITQAFRKAEPAWTGRLAAIVILPGVSHLLESAVHVLRGTPHIITSIATSACFTILSTLFNLYAMQRGALVVGADALPLSADLRRMPGLIGGFLMAGGTSLVWYFQRNYERSRKT